MTRGDDIKELRDKIAKLEDQISDLRRFQSWVIGVTAGAGAILAFVLEGVKKKLGW